ncbi:MAG: squalene/phytoene synthase family protein [Candidatus Diapherotrites archaeon]|nr:squalene/phytoene synthase family protein [Candidatus Diapherotrites archaeon]
MLVKEAAKYCRIALKNVSRSFALTIPMVEKNILTPMVVGYLEARIIDSFEDENGQEQISQYERIKNIDKVIDIISNPDSQDLMDRIDELKDVARRISTNPYYLDLILNMDKVIALHNTLDNRVKAIITRWFSEMAYGMKKYVNVEIKTFNQLNEYCYYVGGTIGGFLTDLILDGTMAATEQQEAILNRNKFDFGRFLQKVNIIRDFRADMMRTGKSFWPRDVFEEVGISPEMALDTSHKNEAMEALNKMIKETDRHVQPSLDYIAAVPSDYEGYRKAFAINLQMGIETLNKLRNNPNVFYSDKPVKISKITKYQILMSPVKRLEKISIQ